ncbi:hypothetical protein SD960_08345 [Flavobacterium sp. MMLR14_040]|uniref:hypothetical protein n=1 Tax=Flavobacterium sp. MMLR14_040 TaxID=3093843 RepID=UPI002990438C|nr:hypothetical protein [Flavobacterium sp. MMLR14_040]MDW8850096.1 hypothetical protein [Flavobacterium sp. MMLR14_040]
MAKKKINIILILVVLGLWGTVGYRAINHQFTGNETILEKQNQLGNITMNQINKDTFELEKINRDAFLNKEFQTALQAPKVIVSHYKPIKKVVIPIVSKTNSNINWPALTYYGYVKTKDQELVLLKINSKICRLKLNELMNGLIVKKKNKDSIQVWFNAENKTIIRNSLD